MGLERELKQKSAGLKTNILICLGSTLFTMISIAISRANVEVGGLPGDPGRIAAQIVSGIGFLGGGAIIQSRATIHGLTTAATIWLVAGLGVAVGMGYGPLALGVAALAVGSLTALGWIEQRLLRNSVAFTVEVVVQGALSLEERNQLLLALEKHHLRLQDYEIHEETGQTRVTLHSLGNPGHHRQFVLALWSLPSVREVRQR